MAKALPMSPLLPSWPMEVIGSRWIVLQPSERIYGSMAVALRNVPVSRQPEAMGSQEILPSPSWSKAAP